MMFRSKNNFNIDVRCIVAYIKVEELWNTMKNNMSLMQLSIKFFWIKIEVKWKLWKSYQVIVAFWVEVFEVST